jgi:RNA polymerase sigma factor (sigma-70 family)
MTPHHEELERHFEHVVTEHSGSLMRALLRMLPHAEAEEVVQEASLKVWSCLYSLEKDAQKPYWFRTARNIAISRLRHEKVHREAVHLLEPLEQMRSVADAAVAHETRQFEVLLREAINELPPVCRNVFVFRKIEGYSQKEIAEKLGVSVNTVENHISNGMRFCRQFITRRLGAPSANSKQVKRLG